MIPFHVEVREEEWNIVVVIVGCRRFVYGGKRKEAKEEHRFFYFS
jgi:hypothetical protein